MMTLGAGSIRSKAGRRGQRKTLTDATQPPHLPPSGRKLAPESGGRAGRVSATGAAGTAGAAGAASDGG